MSDDGVCYLDSSAIVKLIVDEPESAALRDHLRRHARWSSSALARVEVPRAVRQHGAEATDRARLALARLDLVVIDDALLDAAARLSPPPLRSLDAIHLASATALEDDLAELVTYDRRMLDAAEQLRLLAVSPG